MSDFVSTLPMRHTELMSSLSSRERHSRKGPAILRRIAAVAIMAIGTTLEIGCGSNTLSAGDLSGLYEYDPGNQGTGTVCFILSPDGTYAFGNASDPMKEASFEGTPTKGRWQLTDAGDDQQLSMGNSSFPVKRTTSGVRVFVDGDRGMYCDFAKPK